MTPIQALGRTALLSGAFSLLPVFAVVTYLTHRSSAEPLVIAIEALVTIAFFVVYVRFRRVFTAVTRTHFVKRRMLLPGCPSRGRASTASSSTASTARAPRRP
ncbi:hypothetical protein [Frondihabitans sucicola]|uniref:hypothetical protein n=1 Tax=Frondihabitans sucicola TaxID=1268041 RepID=UPI0025724422|nr:hypothetical protein [Frondihabitans sucicola]